MDSDISNDSDEIPTFHTVIVDTTLSVESRLLYMVLCVKANLKGEIELTTGEMGEFLGLSRFPISRHILPPLVERGLVTRVGRGRSPSLTILTQKE